MANPSSAARGRFCREANASARASSRQLVTINGRKMPSAACSAVQPRGKREFDGGHERGNQHDKDRDADLGGQCPADQRCGDVAGREYGQRGEAEAETGTPARC